jgi:hypothetical protein
MYQSDTIHNNAGPCHMPGIELNSALKSSHFSCSGDCYTHFTDVETEAWRL